MKTVLQALSALIILTPMPALANSLIAPGPHPAIAKSSLSATPTDEWNKLSRNEGKNSEIWTRDGDSLNKITFFGGIPVGRPLLREIDKNNRPLPQVRANMLLLDIPALLESTYRIKFAVTQMIVETQEPTLFDGRKGIKFTYSFTRSDDEVSRRGEAIGTIVNHQLYLVTYEAPDLYFFNKDVDKFRSLARSLKF